MAEKSWDDRVAELLERIIAVKVAGGDTKALKEQMKRLWAEKPPEKKDGTES